MLRSIKGEIKIALLNYKYRGSRAKIQSQCIWSGTKIGEGVRIGDSVDISENVSIGRYSYVGANGFVSNSDIGSFVSIGRNVSIGPYQHPYKNLSTSPKVYREILDASSYYSDIPDKCLIGNDVWIGSNAVVMGGGYR